MRKQMVNIDFKKDQGLVLKWNYIDLTKKNNFYRHVLVLLTTKIQMVSIALKSYIKHIKWGDLYTTVYTDSKGVLKVKQWREKTISTDSSTQTYFNQQKINSLTFQTAAAIIQSEMLQTNQPTVLNFIADTLDQVQDLRTKLIQKQQSKKTRFISTIFSPECRNKISISDGVNTMSLRNSRIFEFYHQHLNQMAIESAHLVITCNNGEIGSCNQAAWKNIGFSKIERTFYGPSVKYKQDLLFFINSKRILSGTFDLEISLQFKCFDGKRYTSVKNITINLENNHSYNRTIALDQKYRAYYPKQGIQLSETPYQSQTLVYFDRVLGECRQEIEV